MRLTLKVSGAGRLAAKATVRSGGKAITYAKGAARPRRAGTVSLTLRPTTSGRRALRRHHRLTATMTITFRRASGAAATRRTSLELRRAATGS